MSVHSDRRPVSILDLRKASETGEPFPMLTAYDYLSAQILDEAGVPVILVGDSLGMVMLGHDSTVPVTLDEMIHHTAAVVRGTTNALVVADMPFGTYQQGAEQALASATRFLKETGCNAVKLEGGGRTIESTRLLVDSGIPVMAHLGLTPQSVNQFGGFKVQGRSDEARTRILADAKALEESGAFSLVLECIPSDLADEITEALHIPTIGIGAGAGTDGQVLVWHDFLGLTAGRLPRFVKQYTDLRSQIVEAVREFSGEVADRSYPGDEHQY